MSHYGKFLFFVFLYSIHNYNFKIDSRLFVLGDGQPSGDTQSTQLKKTTNPSELTVAVDIKKKVQTGYNRNIQGSEFTYTTQPEYFFNVVKDAGTEIWNTKDKNEYSKKVVADFSSKTVTVYIGSDGNSTKVFKKGSDNKWVEEGYQTQSSFTSTSGESSGTGCSWSSIWSWIKKWLLCGSCSGSETCGLCGTCGFSGSKTGVELVIKSDTYFSREFDCARHGNYVTYTPKGNYAFMLVKFDEVKIWESIDPSEYSLRVEVDNLSAESKVVTVFQSDDETRIFMKSGKTDPWNEIDVYKVTAKPVNIGYAYESYFSAIETQGKTRTYTAKKGFAFKGANDYYDREKVEIWKTENESEYANKIVNEGGKKVTIHFGEGTSAPTRVFNKEGFRKWKEDTSLTQTGQSGSGAHSAGSATPDSSSSATGGGTSSGTSETWNKVVGWFSSGESGGSSSNSKIEESKEKSVSTSSGGAAKPGQTTSTPAKTGTQQSSGATSDSTTPSKTSTQQQSGGTTAKTDQTSTPAAKTTTPPSTPGQPIGTQASSGSAAKTAGQAGSTTATRSSPGAITTSDKSGTQSPVPAAKTGSQQPSSTTSRTGPSAGTPAVLGQHATSPPARATGDGTKKSGEGEDGSSPTSSSDGASKKGEDDTGTSRSDGSSATPTTNASTDTGIKTGIELSIKATSATNQFNYSKDCQVVKYTAKDDHAFKSVKTKKGGHCGSGGTDLTIWDAKDETEYANKVVLYGKGKKDKIVKIYLPNGTKKVFKRDDKSKPWIEIKQPARNLVTKTGIDLNIKSDNQPTEKFDYDKNGQYVTYIPNDEYAFKLVKDDNTEVWKATDSTNYSCRVEVDTITTHSKAITINQGQDKSLIFIQDKNLNYNEIDTSKINAISVDIGYPYETYCYKYESKDKTATLTPKKGFSFKAVNQLTDEGKVEIWRTNNDNEYSNKVEIEAYKTVTTYCSNYATFITEGKVSIYLPENKTKVFKKDGQKKPWSEVKQNVMQGSKNSTKTASGSK